MQTFNINIHFIVPVTHKTVPLNILYGQKIIFEHSIIPSETGVSQEINFTIQHDAADINPSQIKMINDLNNMPVTITSIKINDAVQNITVNNPQKQIYLDTFLLDLNIEATLLKVIGLPNAISLSHSYVCNGNLYVPKCNRYNSILSFKNDDTYEFAFIVEFFNKDITACLCHIECSFKDDMIEVGVHHGDTMNINQLHENLKNHYIEIHDEAFATNKTATIVKYISLETALSDAITAYSVIKIEGLPNTVDITNHDIFYQNNAYYIGNKSHDSYAYLLSKILDDTVVTVSYYQDNTLEPVFQNIVSSNITYHTAQKTA